MVIGHNHSFGCLHGHSLVIADSHDIDQRSKVTAKVTATDIVIVMVIVIVIFKLCLSVIFKVVLKVIAIVCGSHS